MRNEERGIENWEVDFLILNSSFLIPHFLSRRRLGRMRRRGLPTILLLAFLEAVDAGND